MSTTDLQASLDGLHRELRSAEGLDAETHAKLVEVIREINAERDARQVGASAGLSARIRDTVKHFENEHPALVAAVGRVADALASTGL
jgi:hypothetical protein